MKEVKKLHLQKMEEWFENHQTQIFLISVYLYVCFYLRLVLKYHLNWAEEGTIVILIFIL